MFLKRYNKDRLDKNYIFSLVFLKIADIGGNQNQGDKMQTNANFSLQTFQFSHTSYTQSSVNQKNAKEITNTQANSVPQSTINEDGNGQASNITSSTSLIGNHLSDFQKAVMDRALGTVAQIKDEMLKMWEEVFSSVTNKSTSNSTNTTMTLESFFNTSLEQRILGSGISLSQGFSQSLEVSIQGTIVASDGTQRQLDINIGISQSFVQNLQLNRSNATQNIPQGVNKKIIDPLVIDYEGNGTELSDTKMRFDLDSDGTPDQIATLKKGSGFLALDKNGDGKINDGNELFGTKSGDGFKDLSVYDSNGDGKIDKDDPIYDKLRIWTPDGNGEGKLVGLGEKGVGVIYLNPKESEELMKGESGDLLGIKRKSADFLFNNGNTGNIHHIDLVSEKIKDEAVQNQATNDAILGGQSISQILANKAYQGMGVSASNLSQNSIIPMFSVLGNGITGLFERVPMASLTSLELKANITSLEVKMSFSLNSLQTASNGVSDKVSQIWAKVEANFAKIEAARDSFDSLYIKEDKQNKQNNLVDTLLKGFNEENLKEMNRLLFNPLERNFETFKASLNLRNVHNLLSA